MSHIKYVYIYIMSHIKQLLETVFPTKKIRIGYTIDVNR